MDMTPQEYAAFVKQFAPRSPIVKDTLLAFLVGGAICTLGQALRNAFLARGLSDTDAAAAVSVSLIFLSAFATGLNVYNSLARFAGAGTLVPITGFANAVVAPAIDYRAEGFVTGAAVKMFTIAGPVIVYGVAASAVYGVVLMLTGM